MKIRFKDVKVFRRFSFVGGDDTIIKVSAFSGYMIKTDDMQEHVGLVPFGENEMVELIDTCEMCDNWKDKSYCDIVELTLIDDNQGINPKAFTCANWKAKL